MKKVRESNYELMKIVSMLFIILGHLLLHGGYFSALTGNKQLILRLMEAILIVHVNSFILVNGYFQSQTKFKWQNFFKLNNAAWFYRVVIIVIVLCLNLFELTSLSIIKCILPISIDTYWFVEKFLLLYLISPFLNKLINSLNQKEYKTLLMILFVLFSLISTLTMQKAVNNGCGYSLSNFIFLYFIGAYIAKYSKNYNDEENKINRLKYFGLFLGLGVINFLLYVFCSSIQITGSISKGIFNIIRSSSYCYDNPLILFGSIFYFKFFKTFNFKNKFINMIAASTFSVYLIHDNPYVRQLISNFLHHYPNLYQLKYLLTITISIFVICVIIDLIRVLIFKLIWNLRFLKKASKKWYEFLNKYLPLQDV